MINIKKTYKLMYKCLLLIISFLLAYLIIESILLAVIFTILSLFLLILASKKATRILDKENNINNMCSFVNMMNVTLLNNDTPYESYKEIIDVLPTEFINLTPEDFEDQLLDIANNYDFTGYKLYVNALKDIKDDKQLMLKTLYRANTILDTEIIQYHDERNRKYELLKQINLQYIIVLVLMIFVKIAIFDYYTLMMENSLYQSIIFALLIFGEIFYYISYKEYLKC